MFYRVCCGVLMAHLFLYRMPHTMIATTISMMIAATGLKRNHAIAIVTIPTASPVSHTITPTPASTTRPSIGMIELMVTTILKSI